MSVFNAGAIEGTLTLQRQPFTEGLRAAKLEAERFEKNPIHKRVDLDTAAAEAQLAAFRRQIDEWDRRRTSHARVTADTARAKSDLAGLEARLAVLERTRTNHTVHVETRQAHREIRGLYLALMLLAPTVAPLGASLVPVLGGLAAQFGALVGGAGAGIVAFKGLGSAMQAMNENAAQGTTESLTAMNAELEKLTPTTRTFLTHLMALRPTLTAIQNNTREAAFPGLTAGMDALVTRIPQVNGILSEYAEGLGQVAESTGKALAGEAWDRRFTHMREVAKWSLLETSAAVGHLAGTVVNLGLAFSPLMEKWLPAFNAWSSSMETKAGNLAGSRGMERFIAYIEREGPHVASTLGAIGSAILAVAEAAAPIGSVTLDILTGLSRVVETLADSGAGKVLIGAAVGLMAVNKALTISQRLGASPMFTLLRGGAPGAAGGAFASRTAGVKAMVSDLSILAATSRTAGARTVRELNRVSEAQGRLRARFAGMGGTAVKAGAALGLVAMAASGFAEKAGLSNTVTLALAGSLAGPYGAAAGAAIGFTLDIKAAMDQFAAAVKHADDALKGTGTVDQRTAAIRDLDEQIKKTKESYVQVGSFKFDMFGSEEAQMRAKKRQIEKAIETDKIVTELGFLNDGLRLTGVGFDNVTGGANRFGQSLNAVTDKLTALDALTNYKSALLDINDAIKQNGKTTNINTREGQANMRALSALAASAVNRAKTITDPSKNVRFMDRARDDFIRAAVAMGKTRAEARRLANQLHLIDQFTVKPKVKLDTSGAEAKRRDIADRLGLLDRFVANPAVKLDTSRANAALAALKRKIDAIRHNTIYVNVVQRNRANKWNTEIATNAIGGFYDASPDVANQHTAHVTRRLRVFGEPETRGEAYLPLADDWRRPRAKQLAAMVVDHYGGSVKWNAAGDYQSPTLATRRRTPADSPTGAGATMHTFAPVFQMVPERSASDLAAMLAFEQRRAKRGGVYV